MANKRNSVDLESYQLLKAAGFELNQLRLIWVSQALKKAISFEATQDHDPEWLRKWIEEPVAEGKWAIWFDNPLNAQVYQDILNELGWS